MEYEQLDLSWGPCLESAWSEVQKAMTLIESPPTDKSPPLPWWDKQRMKYRGQITSSMNRCFFHHLASKDPYQDNERLQWSWTTPDASKLGLFLCWTHGNITFKGDLIMYINTKRKVGNITFLELPNIKMEWKMEWNISGKNKTGHNIFPNPNLNNHDSYKGKALTYCPIFKVATSVISCSTEDGIKLCKRFPKFEFGFESANRCQASDWNQNFSLFYLTQMVRYLLEIDNRGFSTDQKRLWTLV